MNQYCPLLEEQKPKMLLYVHWFVIKVIDDNSIKVLNKHRPICMSDWNIKSVLKGCFNILGRIFAHIRLLCTSTKTSHVELEQVNFTGDWEAELDLQVNYHHRYEGDSNFLIQLSLTQLLLQKFRLTKTIFGFNNYMSAIEQMSPLSLVKCLTIGPPH